MTATQSLKASYTQPERRIFAADEAIIEAQFAQVSVDATRALIRAQTTLYDELSAAGLNFEGRSYPVSIRPLLLEQFAVAQLADISERFSHVLDFAAKLYVDNLEVRKLFPAYRNAEHYAIRLPKHRPLIRVYRLDGLFDDAGTFQILETNTDCPGGVIQNGLAARIWSRVPNPLLTNVAHNVLFQPFAANPDLFLKEILQAHRERVGTPAKRAAIVTFRGRFKNEVGQMVAGLNRLGVPTETLDASELRHDNDSLTDADGRKIDVAYNKLDLRDLIDEPAVRDYLEAAAAGHVTFLNPLIGQWPLADKAVLAVLSDPRTLRHFPLDQQRLCKLHIPWTRVLQQDTTVGPDGDRVDLFQFVSTHRSSLVLKPSNATRGEGLLVGPFTQQAEWDATISSILTNNGNGTYVVQEYIPGRKVSAVHPTDGVVSSLWSGVDTYVFGGKFSGFQARASFDPVMNVGRRGILLPVIVKED